MFGSKAWSFNWTDAPKILKGAAIAAGGAALPYAGQLVGLVDETTVIGGVVAAIGSTLLNMARRWMNDYSQSQVA